MQEPCMKLSSKNMHQLSKDGIVIQLRLSLMPALLKQRQIVWALIVS